MSEVLINQRFRFEVWSQSMKRFLEPQEIARVPLAFTSAGYIYFPHHPKDLLLIHYTGFVDMNNRPLLEGDIISCEQITEFGSAIPMRGVVRYGRDINAYSIDVFNDNHVGFTAEVQLITWIGNALTHPDLIHEISVKPTT